MQKMRVLVVDDEQDVRELVVEFLVSRGHEVLQAGGGEEALTILRRTKVDAVFTDRSMPRMRGEEFIRQVRASELQMPVILMTADHLSTEEEATILAAGANAILSKPFFDLTEIEGVLNRLLMS